MESRYTFFARLTNWFDLGKLQLAHYEVNPTRKPDSVFSHHCTLRSTEQGDFETTLWAVSTATDCQIEGWTGPNPEVPREDLVVLKNGSGHILLHDYLTPEEAKQLMAHAKDPDAAKWIAVHGPRALIAPIERCRRGLFHVLSIRRFGED